MKNTSLFLMIAITLLVAACGKSTDNLQTQSSEEAQVLESIDMEQDFEIVSEDGVLTLGEPRIRCRSGVSNDAAVTDDRKTMSLLFTNFSARSGDGASTNQLSVNNCRVVVPVENVPKGYRLAITSVDLFTQASVPRGGYGMVQLMSKISSPKYRHPNFKVYSHVFEPENFDSQVISFHDKRVIGVSECAQSRESFDLDFKITSFALTNELKETTEVNVDSLELKSLGAKGIRPHLGLVRCGPPRRYNH